MNPYRWINFTDCEFYLISSIYFTIRGSNFKIGYSVVDLSLSCILQFQNFQECDALYAKGHSGWLIFEGNTFTGDNPHAAIPIIEARNKVNLIVTGNTFLNVNWQNEIQGFYYENNI